jgi:hypothetical protein
MKTDCFAYRCEKKRDSDIIWLNEYCDCLNDRYCMFTGKCSFFKPKDSVRMVIVNKMVQYEDLK